MKPLVTERRRRSAAQSRTGRRPIWLISGLLVLLALVGAWVRAAGVEPRPLRPFLADSRPVVLAHQGFSGLYRPNTIEAFDEAIRVGADILELDVWTTKDGIIVVHHDEALEEGAPPIREMTREDLEALAPWVPNLETVLQRYPLVRVNIEIKQAEPPMEQALLNLVRQNQAEERILVASFYGDVMKRWGALPGAESVAVSADTVSTYHLAAYYLTWTTRLWQPGADALQLPVSGQLGPFEIRLDTPRLIQAAHRVGVKVHYWTINEEPEMERLLLLGADGIITDYPDRAIRVLKRMGLR